MLLREQKALEPNSTKANNNHILGKQQNLNFKWAKQAEVLYWIQFKQWNGTQMV